MTDLIKKLGKGTAETQGKGLKKTASLKRWEIAQDSEKEYWQGYTSESLKKESGERYPRKARILIKEWQKFIKINKNTRILQVGCGPEDVINHFEIGKLSSADPLADFYKKRFDFNYKKSGLVKGSGESIPFPDKYFDVVILINVLDHVHLPEKVLKELKRVMKDDGIFHFEDYTYQKNFIRIAKLYGSIKKAFTGEIFNIHHPYMFTAQDLRTLIRKEFKIVHEEIGRDIGCYESFEEMKRNKRKDKKLTTKLPALFGLYGIINYSCICKK